MKRTISSLFVAGGLAFAVGAQAVVITDDFSVGHQTTELDTTSATGTLDQFDSSLGNLTGVSITLSGESISSALLENTAAQSQRFSFDSVLNWEFEVLAGSENFETAFVTNLASTGGTVSLDSGVELDLGETTDQGSVTLTFAGADLAQFIGAGTVGIGCNTLTGTNFVGGGGNIDNEQTTTAACSGEISYDFEGVAPPPPGPAPVPEPASLWLIGAGLLGFTRASARKSS